MKKIYQIPRWIVNGMQWSILHFSLAIIFANLAVASSGNAQELLNQRITLQVSDQKLNSILSEIEKAVDVRFSYSPNLIRASRKVSFNLVNEKLSVVLEKLLVPNKLKFQIVGKQIILLRDAVEKQEEESFLPKQSSDGPPLEVVVAGTVKDEKGTGLPGVNILVKGTLEGTTTDQNGNYSLKVAKGDMTLVFSFVGYLSQEKIVADQSVINVTLVTDQKSLEEVIVVGYGTQKKRDVTGSISQIKSDDLKGLPVTGLDQAMQGKAAGVQVTQNSGEPGGSVSVRIRGVGTIGSNEPLYIVDGLPTGSLNSINPNDIESIEILKDAASASIYGSRGANGVVLVTTKRGKEGKTRIVVDAFVGVQATAKEIKVLNGPDFATLANESVVNTNNDPRANVPKDNPLNPLWSNPSSLPTYNWQDAIFQNSPVQSYNVSISGGTAKSRTVASFGYFRQDGLIVNSKYDRFTGRINSDYQLNARAKFGHSINISRDNKRSVPTDASAVGMLQTAYQMHPMQPIFAPDGLQSETVFGLGGYAHFPLVTEARFYPRQLYNPIYGTKVRENEQVSLRLLGTVFGEYEILPGMSFRSSIGIELGNGGSKSYTPYISANIFGNTTRDDASEGMDRSYSWNWINTLNYSKTFGKHAVGALVGIDALRGASSSLSGSASSFANPNVRTFGFALPANRNVSNGASDFALLSYLGRINYAFNDKYLLQFNVRRDGSVNFGPKNRYGVFPSVAAGWRISQESFMKSVSSITDLKIRASWGQLGNQSIPNFQYLNTLSSDQIEYTLGTGSQAAAGGITVRSLANPDIKWEATTQSDIGLDASLWQGRVNVTADYYERETTDMLVNIPVPISLGAPNNSILRNAGGMKNSGIELSLGYRQNTGQFNWSADANFATLKNEVTSLGQNGRPIVNNFNEGQNNAATQTVVGQSLAYFWGYKTDGIFQNQEEIDVSPMKETVIPGDRRYVDVNGDGKVDGNDRVNLGNGLPKIIYGATLRADYKGFDASVLLQGQAGNKISNNAVRALYDIRNSNGQGVQNVSQDMMGRWTGPGTSNTMPRVAYFTSSDNNRFSDVYIENGAFLRCRNAQIGFTVPQNLSQKAGIERLRIYLAAQNLFTITKYSGFDPEIGSRSQNALTTGVDQGRYPVAKVIMGGLNISF
ncbi:MAG: TonB-dependent receptor [Dyadobacter sp.]|uniref:TonB-dependent receptor n=1 Tax=Dyadobacter sp. TaxID=1914288 RepID=UPI003263A753